MSEQELWAIKTDEGFFFMYPFSKSVEELWEEFIDSQPCKCAQMTYYEARKDMEEEGYRAVRVKVVEVEE